MFQTYLDLSTVNSDLEVSSKRELFTKLAHMVKPRAGIEPLRIIQALLTRERLGPTACGHGIALPHAMMSGLKSPVLAIARLQKPLDYGTWNGEPVDIACLLLVPPMEEGDAIQMLSRVECALRQGSLLEALRQAPTAEAMYQLLHDAPHFRIAA